MFGSIGITEIMVIAVIALIFLGPEKFPEFAKIMARTVRDIRGYVQDAQKDIAEELKPIKKELDKLSSVDPEAYLEKLADAADDEDEDAGIIPEPDITPMDLYKDEGGEAESPEGTVEYERYDQPAEDEDKEPEPPKTELDG